MKKLKCSLRKISALLVISYTLLQITSCSSTKGALGFERLNYPASMSAFLYDQNQNIVVKGTELESVYSFKIKKTFWSFAYGLIPLVPKHDICDSINAVVNEFKGDGIINLTVTIEQGVVNKVYSFLLYLPSYIPIFPSSADITVSGEVVKLIGSESKNEIGFISDEKYISKENLSIKLNEAIDEIN